MGVTTTDDSAKPSTGESVGPLNESRRTSRIVIRTIICKEKKFNLDKFLQQFNTLDMNNYGSWPISVKLRVGFLFSLLC